MLSHGLHHLPLPPVGGYMQAISHNRPNHNIPGVIHMSKHIRLSNNTTHYG